MPFQRILANELLNTRLVEVGRDDVNELHRYVNAVRNWCPDVNIEICTEFVKVLDEVAEVLSRLRLVKLALYRDVPEGTVDRDFLTAILDLTRQYYRLLIHGLVDSGGNVYVRVVRDVCVGNLTYLRGAMTSIPAVDALLLSRLGYVKIMDDIVR